MNSDMGRLSCHHNFNVIEDWSEWKQGKMNMLMLQENTAPGYCRLQLLRPDVPRARGDLPNEHFTYDDRGRVLMKNTFMHERAPGYQHTRNGPASSSSSTMPGKMDTDDVHAKRCSIWPAQAEEFTRGRRRYGWPTQRLLQQAVQGGVFLVPAGHKLSQLSPCGFWRDDNLLQCVQRCLAMLLTWVTEGFCPNWHVHNLRYAAIMNGV